MLEKILKNIKENNLILPKEKIGVAVSGGEDSMCLLYSLNKLKNELNIELIAININHQIRENSKADTDFVINYCKENNINCHSFKVNALDYAKQNKLTLEESARILRYGVFESLIKKQIVNKIAIAHHSQDQVETILLNILRGTGLKGASGMDWERDGFIRPMLNIQKREITSFLEENNISHVTDETNFDTEYSRNFLRQNIIPQIKSHWKNFDVNLLNFSKICKEDDDYINSIISFDNLIFEHNLVKIPLSMFIYKSPVVNRLIRKALEHLHLLKDIKNKHINIIKDMAKNSENGTKINLPHNLVVHKEYDYITILIKQEKKKFNTKKFELGKQKLNGEIEIIVKKHNSITQKTQERTHLFDLEKLPKDAIWRTKQIGDTFTKFGGGTKKIKDYLIDKKVPSRLRCEIPMLCSGNEVYIILGVEISDKIKITEDTKQFCTIRF